MEALTWTMSIDPRKDDLKKCMEKSRKRQKLIASIPMPQEDLLDLLNYLDRENPPPCDHTLRETVEFLQKRGLDVERVVPWLREHGGYCDCEVIFNVGRQIWRHCLEDEDVLPNHALQRTVSPSSVRASRGFVSRRALHGPAEAVAEIGSIKYTR